MSKEETIKNLKKLKSFHNGSYGTDIAEAIKALEQPSYKSEARRWKRRYLDLKQRIFKLGEQTRWIPIKTRPMTEEEKEEIGHEYAFMYDCSLPDDGQEVLITDCHGNVEVDTFCRDYEGFYFETNCDDDEVIAWMPLPAPYQPPKMMCEED